MTPLTPDRRKLLERILERKGVRRATPAAIARREDAGGPLPLSFAQEQIWFLDQLAPDRALHNVPAAVRMRGPLDPSALERSLDRIVERHETLRTTFVEREGLPAQVVHPHRPVRIPLADLAALPGNARLEEAIREATAEAHRPFDLAAEPPVRSHLLRLAPDDHVFLLNLHHAAADGWSMGVLTRELRELYPAFRHGREASLPELPFQFGDFALWQRTELAGERLQTRLGWWKERLADAPALRLETDRPRPPLQSFRGRHFPVRIPAARTASLRRLALREGATPFMTLFAGFLAALHAVTGQTDLVVGSVHAGRERPGLAGLIAHLLNPLVLRVDLSGNPEFRELVRRVRETTLGTLGHAEIPFLQLLRELRVRRDLSRNPLFQVSFSLLTPEENPAVYGYGLGEGVLDTIELEGLEVRSLPVEYAVSRYDLSVFLWDLPDGIAGAVEYAADLFDERTIARLVDAYERLLLEVGDSGSPRLDLLRHHVSKAGTLRQADAAPGPRDEIDEAFRNLRPRVARSGGS